MVGSSATDDYATKFNGLQALPQQDGTYKDYELTFAEKHDENKSGSTYLGYWTNATNKELKASLKNMKQVIQQMYMMKTQYYMNMYKNIKSIL